MMVKAIAETVEEVESWSDLALLIDEHANGEWLFRGITNRNYKLMSKIGRAGARKNPHGGESLPYNEDAEILMFEEFCRTARPYVPDRDLNKIEWLAIAQHHGMPTRLLDWTESPLVAAYFACESAGTGREPPAIIAVRDVPMFEGDDPFTGLAQVSLYRPPHISPRIPAQSGVFTVHPNPNRQEFLVTQLEKWVLVGKSRETFWLKQILATCGINRAALFPDLDGLAQYMGWRYKWSKFEGIDPHS